MILTSPEPSQIMFKIFLGSLLIGVSREKSNSAARASKRALFQSESGLYGIKAPSLNQIPIEELGHTQAGTFGTGPEGVVKRKKTRL